MDFINLISNVGFPISCCIFVFYLFYKCLLPLKDSVEKNTALLKYVLSVLGVEEDE